MSYTSIYELYKTKVNSIAELGNSYGSGPAIWDYVSQKLYGKRFNMFADEGFWPSYKSNRLDDDEKAVLLSTYDYAFIEIDHLEEFADACRKVHKNIIETTNWTWSHFESIGDVAGKIHKKHDSRCIGMAIGCTSVSDIWEQVPVKDIDYWGVYEQIRNIKSSESMRVNK